MTTAGLSGAAAASSDRCIVTAHSQIRPATRVREATLVAFNPTQVDRR
jgi:hypothetical protein